MSETPKTKSLVDQLRSQHITLFLSCAALLVTPLLRNETREQATADAIALAELQQQMSRTWLHEHAAKRVAEWQATHSTAMPRQLARRFALRISLRDNSVSTFAFLSHAPEWTLEPAPQGVVLAPNGETAETPASLSDFEALWNAFAGTHVVHILSIQDDPVQAVLNCSGQLALTTVTISPLPPVAVGQDPKIAELVTGLLGEAFMEPFSAKYESMLGGDIQPKLSEFFSSAGVGATHYVRCPLWKTAASTGLCAQPSGSRNLSAASWSPTPEVFLPVGSIGIPLDGQGVLSGLARREWKSGPFDASFPELSQVATHMKSLQIADVAKILKAENARKPELIQLLGVQIPLGWVTSLGVLAVIVLQGHMWLHMKMLAARWDSGNAEAWVGLDPDFWCQITFVSTGILLPVGTAVVLQFAEVSGLGVSLVVFSVLLAFATFSAWRRMRPPNKVRAESPT